MAGGTPLGVDIGATRVRIVEARPGPGGHAVLRSAVRDLTEGASSSGAITDVAYLAAVLEDAVEELGTRERRCVCAVGEPDARYAVVAFPAMRAAERERAARFEAEKHCSFPVADAVVRVHRAAASGTAWVLGMARSAAVRTRMTALRQARLRPIAMDHEAFALKRALPGFDAVLDVGFRRSSLHCFADGEMFSLTAFGGGDDVTRAIERDLRVDRTAAEKRKRIVGTAGAGERARSALVTDITGLIEQASRRVRLSRIAMVGNGSRLCGLDSDVSRASGTGCTLAVSPLLAGPSYPQDVVRSSAPDWTLAASLAQWRRSE